MTSARWFFAALVAIAAFGIAQLTAAYLGIAQAFGWGWALFAIAVTSLFQFTLPMTVASFWGAMKVWGWPWWGAALFAAPGLAFAIPDVLITIQKWLREVIRSGAKGEAKQPIAEGEAPASNDESWSPQRMALHIVGLSVGVIAVVLIAVGAIPLGKHAVSEPLSAKCETWPENDGLASCIDKSAP